MSQAISSAGAFNRLSCVLVPVLLWGTGCSAGDVGDTNGWVTPRQMYERAVTFEALGITPWARSWYHKAAEAGHPIAQVKLGFLYRYGRADLLDDAYEAQRWFLRAARERVPAALADFQMRNAYGYQEEVKDRQEAERWFRRGAASCRVAAARGDAAAQTLLGGLYGAGAGVEQDRAVALQLWTDAANRGYGPAQLILGRLYWHEASYEAARRWLIRAAAHDLPEADYLLSQLYQFGRGVTPNHAEALAWLRRSAAQGYAFAERELRGMEAQGFID